MGAQGAPLLEEQVLAEGVELDLLGQSVQGPWASLSVEKIAKSSSQADWARLKAWTRSRSSGVLRSNAVRKSVRLSGCKAPKSTRP
jgi:hypothetical protein